MSIFILPAVLNNVCETLLVVLEAAGLPQTRHRLAKKWLDLENKGGIGKTTFLEQYQYLESEPFEYLEKFVQRLRVLAGDGLRPGDSYELAMLETILKRTPVLMRKRNIHPKDEKEIRDVMHDYLEALFTEYKRDVTIPGVIRNFKPDGGVRNLKTAIEFKFASTQQEVLVAIGGIFEDTGGYTGSLDWTRFYSVIYQTDAFESEDRVRSELTRGGTLTWKHLLVTGSGTRPAKQLKNPASR